MKRHNLLPLLLVLSILGYACGGVRRELPLEVQLSPVDSTDTLASVLLWGADARHSSLLAFAADAPLRLEPDTSLYRELLISHAQGREVHYYSLVDGAWQEGLPSDGHHSSDSLTQLPDSAVDFSGYDVRKQYKHFSELYAQGRTILVFAAPHTFASLTKAQVKRLQESYPADSLRFVYMVPHYSDSVVRRLLKQDSLTGVAFSDSVGLVSQARRDYGVGRTLEPVVFVLDSLGGLTRHNIHP